MILMTSPVCMHMTRDQWGTCAECGVDVFTTDAASRSRYVVGDLAVLDVAPLLTGNGHNLRALSISFLTHITTCHEDPCGKCTMLRVSRLGPIDGLRKDAAHELARRSMR